MSALVTSFHMATQRSGTAVLHSPQHASLGRVPSVSCQVFVSLRSKHIGHFQPRSGHASCFALASAFVEWLATNSSKGLLIWLINFVETCV